MSADDILPVEVALFVGRRGTGKRSFHLKVAGLCSGSTGRLVGDVKALIGQAQQWELRW
jgi:hypothetical protein